MDNAADSRKRPLDTDGDDGFSKRSNHGDQDIHKMDDVHLKMMVPGCAAGAIIGKGGDMINLLQRDTNANIKMSKNQDTFPGTTERLCLIVGTLSACQLAHDAVAQQIHDKPNPNPHPGSDGGDKINYDRHKQTKFVIPSQTAGRIIGKGGASISDVKEKSGANVTVSKKSNDSIERIVTVTGEGTEIRAAMKLLLEQLALDPQSRTCWSLSYSPQANRSSSGPHAGSSFSGFGQSQPMGGGSNSSSGTGGMSQQQLQQAAQSLAGMMRGFGGSQPARERNPVVDQLSQTLRMTGYSEQGAEEIAGALAVLANYGVLGLTGGGLLGNLMNMHRLSLNGSANSSNLPSSGSMSHSAGLNSASAGLSGALNSGLSGASSNLSQTPSLLSSGSGLGSSGGISSLGFPSDDSSSLLRQLTETLARGSSSRSDPFSSMKSESSQLFSGFSDDIGGFNKDRSPDLDDKQEIEVAEDLAGVIIGPGGRGVSEIYQVTGAKVQVSKRGVHAPGTNNRIVVISGPASSVSRAAQMVRSKIVDAESRRSGSHSY